MLLAEFLDLLLINQVGQNPGRLVSGTREPVATQKVNDVLPAVLHNYHQALASVDATGNAGLN